jgi:hypothetical protein
MYADSKAWGSTVAASCDLLRVAHRLGVLAHVHVSNSPETLPTHLSLVLQQCSVLGSTLASASAAALVGPLIDIDTRLVAVHLRPMWRAVWLGSASSPEPCRAAACNLIAAFGDTRQLDLLLLETSAAMRNSLAGESAGMAAVMCASDVAAAWFEGGRMHRKDRMLRDWTQRVFPPQPHFKVKCWRHATALLAARARITDRLSCPTGAIEKHPSDPCR